MNSFIPLFLMLSHRPTCLFTFVYRLARDIVWRVRYLRTKNAHKQLARTSLSSATDFDGKTERHSVDIIETKTTEEQNTQSKRDQEKDYVRPPLQTDETQPESCDIILRKTRNRRTLGHGRRPLSNTK